MCWRNAQLRTVTWILLINRGIDRVKRPQTHAPETETKGLIDQKNWRYRTMSRNILLNWSLLTPEIFCAIASLHPANTPEVIAYREAAEDRTQRAKDREGKRTGREKRGKRSNLCSQGMGLELLKVALPRYSHDLWHVCKHQEEEEQCTLGLRESQWRRLIEEHSYNIKPPVVEH